jgi:hypothetical protein
MLPVGMKQTLAIILLSLFALSLLAAPRSRGARPAPMPPPLSFHFDFSGGELGWEAGFADYSAGMDLGTTGELRTVPHGIGGGTAWYLSGSNYSDDLFMFLRRGLEPSDGIVPGQNYLASFTLTLATNAALECGGIGGHPGESVYIKLGAAPIRPEPLHVHAWQSQSGSDYIQMNVDKGNQAQGGVHASTAGTVTSPTPIPCGGSVFAALVRRHDHPHAIRASPEGALWLLFGVDSGFEGFNQIYVQKIEVTLTPVPSSHPAVRWQSIYAEIDSLVGVLEEAGILLRHGYGGIDFELLDARELQFGVGESGSMEELLIYVFDTAAAAERGRSLISPDGSRIGTLEMNWIAPPHFFMGDHFIVNYVGSSSQILALLTERFGAQFAGL